MEYGGSNTVFEALTQADINGVLLDCDLPIEVLFLEGSSRSRKR